MDRIVSIVKEPDSYFDSTVQDDSCNIYSFPEVSDSTALTINSLRLAFIMQSYLENGHKF